ncbi:MAG: TRAP transporter small permease [Candidatus Methylomirabilales bacterium]
MWMAALDRWVQGAGRAAVVLALLAIMALLTLGILIRIVPVMSVAGYDELIELLMAWMTFLGAAVLWGEGCLYRVDVVVDRLPRRAARILGLLVYLLMLLFAATLTLQGWRVAVLSAETTPFLRFPKSLAYASMPVAGAIMLAYTLSGLVRAARGRRE